MCYKLQRCYPSYGYGSYAKLDYLDITYQKQPKCYATFTYSTRAVLTTANTVFD